MHSLLLLAAAASAALRGAPQHAPQPTRTRRELPPAVAVTGAGRRPGRPGRWSRSRRAPVQTKPVDDPYGRAFGELLFSLLWIATFVYLARACYRHCFGALPRWASGGYAPVRGGDDERASLVHARSVSAPMERPMAPLSGSTGYVS